MHPGNRTLILSRTTVIVALAVAFALVLSTALLSAFAARGLARTDALGHRAKSAIAATTQLLATIADAENAARRRDLGADGGAESLGAICIRLREEVLGLGGLLAARPGVMAFLNQLEWLSREAERAAASPQLVAAGPDDQSPDVIAVATFAEMRRLVYVLQRQEFAALVEYSAVAAARAQDIQALNAGLMTIAVALATAGSWLLLRRMRDLEGLITVCAWTRRVRWQGQWISFEEYLARRFNLRCTHGICEEAAEQMRQEIAGTAIPAELRRG